MFYAVALVKYGESYEVLTGMFFLLTSTIAFYVPIVSVDRIAGIRDFYSQKWQVYSLISILIVLGPLLLVFFYTIYFVPIFEPEVEKARVLLIEYTGGIPYRISIQACYFLASASIIVANIIDRKRSVLFFIWLLTFVLIFFAGFRCRLVDFIAISVISIFAANYIRYGMCFHNLGKILVFGLLGFFISICALAYLTWVRLGGLVDLRELIDAIIYRVFYLNYEVNISGRIYEYVEIKDYLYGNGYLSDFISIFTSNIKSMQEVVTSFFNASNSELFVMTPTIYGEMYLNFGKYSFLLAAPIILLYRIVLESPVVLMRRIAGLKVISVISFLNIAYYFPRQSVTGGISNAFLIRGVSILLVSLIVSCFLLFMVFILNRRA